MEESRAGVRRRDKPKTGLSFAVRAITPLLIDPVLWEEVKRSADAWSLENIVNGMRGESRRFCPPDGRCRYTHGSLLATAHLSNSWLG